MVNHLTYESWDYVPKDFTKDLQDYMDVLKWSFNEYGDQILYACSFGAEGVVLLDLISKIKPNARIVFLDTQLHFKETYDLITNVRSRYPDLKIDVVKPKLSLEKQSSQFGEELWKHNPNLCCHLRKIIPLEEQLSSVHAWISGLRREQSPTRKTIEYINKDERFKKVKICPLINWTWEDVWSYIGLNNLSYNVLHDHQYPSIGCENCTLPSTDGNTRSGRWAGRNKIECGLHQS
jgi:phosphoadenosine phosphosulfate reductase